MKGADDSPSSQEVDPAAPQLARTGTGEHEAPTILRFEQGMDDVEELGHALDFVDNHGRAPGRPPNEIAQSLGPGGELARDVGLEEVDDERIGQGMAKPCRFAGAAGTEEEEALPRRLKESALQFHCESQNGNDDSRMLAWPLPARCVSQGRTGGTYPGERDRQPERTSGSGTTSFSVRSSCRNLTGTRVNARHRPVLRATVCSTGDEVSEKS